MVWRSSRSYQDGNTESVTFFLILKPGESVMKVWLYISMSRVANKSSIIKKFSVSCVIIYPTLLMSMNIINSFNSVIKQSLAVYTINAMIATDLLVDKPVLRIFLLCLPIWILFYYGLFFCQKADQFRHKGVVETQRLLVKSLRPASRVYLTLNTLLMLADSPPLSLSGSSLNKRKMNGTLAIGRKVRIILRPSTLSFMNINPSIIFHEKVNLDMWPFFSCWSQYPTINWSVYVRVQPG